MVNHQDFNILDKVDSLNEGLSKITLSLVYMPTEIVLVRASKKYNVEKESSDPEWGVEFEEDVSMSGDDMSVLSYALMRLSDAMKDVDYNLKTTFKNQQNSCKTVDNTGCYFPDHIEGYWRQQPEKDESGLPFPVISKDGVDGYSKEQFLTALHDKEREGEDSKLLCKGSSICRLTGEANSSAEYSMEGWKWPAGYKSYIEKGVLPSADFYAFIMGAWLDGLISYHR